jgi:hypothetical protein
MAVQSNGGILPNPYIVLRLEDFLFCRRVAHIDSTLSIGYSNWDEGMGMLEKWKNKKKVKRIVGKYWGANVMPAAGSISYMIWCFLHPPRRLELVTLSTYAIEISDAEAITGTEEAG